MSMRIPPLSIPAEPPDFTARSRTTFDVSGHPYIETATLNAKKPEQLYNRSGLIFKFAGFHAELASNFFGSGGLDDHKAVYLTITATVLDNFMETRTEQCLEELLGVRN